MKSKILESVISRKKSKNRTIENAFYHIHIPKTAGTFLNKIFKNENKYIDAGHLFGREDIKHYGHIAHFKRGMKYWGTYIYKNEFRENISFSVVRSPIPWLKSYYSHNSHTNNNNHTGWASVRDYHDFNSFEEFCEAFLDESFHFHLDVLRKFQLAQCFDINDNCRVDFLVYNESIDKFLKVLEDDYLFKIDHTIMGDKINSSSSADVVMSGKLEKRLLLYFSQHMSLFGYQTDGSIDTDKAILDTDGIVIDPYGLKFSCETGKIYL